MSLLGFPDTWFNLSYPLHAVGFQCLRKWGITNPLPHFAVSRVFSVCASFFGQTHVVLRKNIVLNDSETALVMKSSSRSVCINLCKLVLFDVVKLNSWEIVHFANKPNKSNMQKGVNKYAFDWIISVHVLSTCTGLFSISFQQQPQVRKGLRCVTQWKD